MIRPKMAVTLAATAMIAATMALGGCGALPQMGEGGEPQQVQTTSQDGDAGG